MYEWGTSHPLRLYITNLFLLIFVLVAGVNRQAYRAPIDSCKGTKKCRKAKNQFSIMHAIGIVSPSIHKGGGRGRVANENGTKNSGIVFGTAIFFSNAWRVI